MWFLGTSVPEMVVERVLSKEIRVFPLEFPQYLSGLPPVYSSCTYFLKVEVLSFKSFKVGFVSIGPHPLVQQS